MNGVSWVRVRSAPKRASGAFAWKTRTGSDLPLSVAGFELLVVEDLRRRLVGVEADRDPHLGRDGLDPRGGVDRVAGEHPLSRAGHDPKTDERLAGVDADAERQRRSADASSSAASSAIRSAARTARSGSSSWAAGTPKTPTTASPMNFSTTPPYASIRSRAIAT